MKLVEDELRVYYAGRVRRDLDDKIEDALFKCGYIRWASGYDYADKCRDLAFEKATTNTEEKKNG